MDQKQRIDNELLQKVHNAQLKDILARFLEDTRHSHLLNTSIISHVIPELINILIDCKLGHKDTQMLLQAIHVLRKRLLSILTFSTQRVFVRLSHNRRIVNFICLASISLIHFHDQLVILLMSVECLLPWVIIDPTFVVFHNYLDLTLHRSRTAI